MHELTPDSEQSYICKIASMEEQEAKWTYEIEKNADDPDWPIWKKQAFERTEKGQSIPYYGILNGQIITEATALLDEAIVQNSCGLVDDKTAYLSAFRTVEAYQGQGYFSKTVSAANRFLPRNMTGRILCPAWRLEWMP